MKTKSILVSLFVLVILSQINTSFAVQNMSLYFWMNSTKLSTDDLPTVRGTVRDEKGIPINNATIQVPFSYEVAETYTNPDGSFTVQSSSPAGIGQHMITVEVYKEGFDPVYGSIMFEVANKTSIPSTNSSKLDSEKQIDLISSIMQKQKEQFSQQQDAQEQKDQDTAAQNASLNQQREQADQSLQSALDQMDTKNEFNSPRNAFMRFIQDFDSLIQGIFLDSFSFTEQKTNEGHQAKMNAISEGKSPSEAMKAFNDKAAVSRDEIMGLNKNLNIKYNLANNTIQNTFDSHGKIPRTDP